MAKGRALGLAVVVAIVVVALLASRPSGIGPAPMPKGPHIEAVEGTGRTLPPALLGVNGEAILNRTTWRDPGFLSAVADLHPQSIRVFGGTPANFWNWRAGTYVHSPHVPGSLAALRAHIRLTLAGWARVVHAAHATAVFDLNMVTSGLGSQLAMLHAAQRVGLPVRYVELGNELYMPQYSWRFSNGADYGRVSTRWIAAIRSAFPGVAIAADAYPGTDRNSGLLDPRERDWNAELLSTLHGASAVSLHPYFISGLGPGASLRSPAAAERLLGSPGRRWASLARLIAGLPAGLSVWVTEWNLFDTVARVHGTWAQGLAVAAFGLGLATEPRVVQSDYEALVDSAPFGAIFGSTTGLQLSPVGTGSSVAFRAVRNPAPATPVFGLATGGVAMRALISAAAGANLARPLGFRSVPVTGAAFAGPRGFAAVILNLSNHPYTLSVPKLLRGLSYTEWWGRPITLVAGTPTLHEGVGKTGAHFGLEPFSLLQIGGRKAT